MRFLKKKKITEIKKNGKEKCETREQLP